MRRIPPYRPALKVGVSLGVDTKVFEVSRSFGKYIYTNMIYFHNPINFGKQIIQVYEQYTLTKEDLVKIASEWYSGREDGTASNHLLFTKSNLKDTV